MFHFHYHFIRVNHSDNIMIPNDPLHIIDMKNWTDLKKELENDWPRSVIFYQWIITRLQNEEKEPGAHPFYVCCPNGIIKDGLVSFGKIVSLFFIIDLVMLIIYFVRRVCSYYIVRILTLFLGWEISIFFNLYVRR